MKLLRKNLDAISRSLPPRFLSQKFSREDVEYQQNTYLTNATGAVKAYPHHDDLIFAFPVMGAYSIMEQLVFRGEAPDHMHAVPIWGSEGTSSGSSRIHGNPAKELLDPQKTVLLMDDVLDTCVSSVKFALMRREWRLGAFDHDEYADLADEIGRARGKDDQKKKFDDPAMIPLFKKAAQLFREEKIILTPLYVKNDTAMGFVFNRANQDTKTQEDILQLTVITGATPVGEDEWIMGGQGMWHEPLLDTDVKGERIISLIPDDAEGKHIKAELKRMKFDRLKLRIGAGIHTLTVYNPDHDSDGYQQFEQFITDLIVDFMKKRAEEEN